MADFRKALRYVMANEGDWSDDPDDPGGPTMKGITLAVAQKYGINTKEELHNISDELIERIYRAGYWRFDGIKDQDIATKIMDMCVNRGIHRGIELVQMALRSLQSPISVDGFYGPITERTINACDSDLLMDQLISINVESYKKLTIEKPKLKKFLNGWLIRARKKP